MPKWKNRPHSFWLTTSTTLSPNTPQLFIFPAPGPEAMCLTRPSLSSNLFIVTQHAKKVTKSAFFFLSLSSRSQSGACCTSDPFCTAGIRGGEQTTIWRKSRDTLHREGVIGGRNGSAEVSERQILGNCLCGARGGRNFEKKKKRGHGRSLAESSYQLSGDAICHATG